MPSSDILDLLGFLGQLGMGMGYFLARLFGWGASSVLVTLGSQRVVTRVVLQKHLPKPTMLQRLF